MCQTVISNNEMTSSGAYPSVCWSVGFAKGQQTRPRPTRARKEGSAPKGDVSRRAFANGLVVAWFRYLNVIPLEQFTSGPANRSQRPLIIYFTLHQVCFSLCELRLRIEHEENCLRAQLVLPLLSLEILSRQLSRYLAGAHRELCVL